MSDPGPPIKRWHTREDSGIRLDAEGVWWHDDERIEHPRIIEIFNQSLQPTDDGRFKLVFGWDWCFVTVDGPAYRVLAAHAELDADGNVRELQLALSDRTQESLDPDTLTVGEDGVLTCSVKQRRATARFTRDAQFHLGSLLEESEARDEDGAPTLRIGGRTWMVRPTTPRE